MGMKIKLVFFNLIFISLALAGNLDELFKSGNELYAGEKFPEAITTYQKVLSQGYESSELYFNLGNAYFRLNNTGRAILNYERALQLNPHDSDIKYNLELAQLKVVDRVSMPPRFFLFEWWDAAKYYYSLGQLSNFMLIVFMLTIALLIGWQLFKNSNFARFFTNIAAVSGILFLFTLYVFISRINELNNTREAIILESTVNVMSAPDENSTDVFILHEGIKIILDNEREDWVKIRLADGKEGWIKKTFYEEL